jgi:phosphomannomutase
MKLSESIFERIAAYPFSGEINSKLADPKAGIKRVLAFYEADSTESDQSDGISLEFHNGEGKWSFNLRSSNTEPVVRLNVESQGFISLMKEKTKEIILILNSKE